MKRGRSSSTSSSSSGISDTASTSSGPLAKHQRRDLIPHEKDAALTCQLPPTCLDQPNTFETEAELKAHYERCHAHTCEVDECGKIFPDARLLRLHIIENHDALAALRQKAGRKIFECFLPPDICGKTFMLPRGRRKHMVEVHHYSKQYFFSVTNHGIADMVKRFGPGASMIRPAWQPDCQKTSIKDKPDPGQSSQTDSPFRGCRAARGTHVTAAGHDTEEGGNDMDVDALTQSLATTSLAFVPASVNRKKKAQAQQNVPMKIDHQSNKASA